ncbi:MAG: PAS domain S-box protein, partial [Desulfobacca sp.]|nr:PAS domain S-box protein [Desulfobacca sp.]
CPAYGDRRRRCWYLPGTLCPECAAGDYAQKIEACQNCPVYKENLGDEIQSLAESFDVMALSLSTHIDELKEAERNLVRQQQLLKTILDATPDMVSLQDDNFLYRAVNPAFCQYLGLEVNDIIGKSDVEIFPPTQAESNRREDLQILQTGFHLSKEIKVNQDGKKHWFHLVKIPVYAQDRIVGLLMTARDITEVKQYQEQLIQSLKMEQLGKLAGGVAHEINTPLCIILGYAQMLLEDLPQDSESHEFLKIIEKQAQICRGIVADLLGFSRQIESKMEEMDLNQSIEEVLQLVRHPFKQHWVDLEVDLASDVPTIVGDKEKLKQVWMNLLNNAFDAVGEGGSIAVTTRLCPRGQRILVTFADNGSGIRSENLNRIFDPFFTTKAPTGGTGLGLSVSFGIIQDHHGKISVASPIPTRYRDTLKAAKDSTGPGTIFLIELPVSREEAGEDVCEELWSQESSLPKQVAG